MAKPLKVRILHRDKYLVVVHKPSGILVYSDSKEDGVPSCYDLVKKMLAAQTGGMPVQLFPTHRIDRGTCGIVIFALDSKTASLLLRDFQQGKILKTYWALVFGKIPSSGDIRVPLPGNKTKEKQAAHTRYHRLGYIESPELEKLGDPAESCFLSWVECLPKTGRYHQIRRHFKGEGFPLLGDEQYAGEKRTAFCQEAYGLRRIALSAVAVSFVHPVTRKKFVIETNPDEKLEKIIKSMKWITTSQASR